MTEWKASTIAHRMAAKLIAYEVRVSLLRRNSEMRSEIRAAESSANAAAEMIVHAFDMDTTAVHFRTDVRRAIKVEGPKLPSEDGYTDWICNIRGEVAEMIGGGS